ncbi:C80 family cysteine peptidase, partial [Bathymodiolus thermophilus thioautotrophic gill symbiont]
MDELVDKVKQINDTYGNENTYFERIALVGCDATSVDPILTKNFAKAVYGDISTLRNAQITGRGGEINEDGTKTITDGNKKVYSWDETVQGNIKERTETVKSYSDYLKNPLNDSAAETTHPIEATPYQDALLENWKNWSDISKEQLDKIATESQTAKSKLFYYDHQIIIQSENDDNVKNTALDMFAKYPGQTTIVQMQKDGTYQTTQGTELRDITGKIKVSVVGFGRKGENGNHKLGGRSPDELKANIVGLNQGLNPRTTTIEHVDLVGCNTSSDNPTDNNDSNYGTKVLQKLWQIGVTTVGTESTHTAVDVGASNTEEGSWRRKDGIAKTVYSVNARGNIVSKVYSDEGVSHNTQTPNETRYKSNIIVQNSSDKDVVGAANALFEKHPDNSIIVKFGQNNRLVTLKGEAYIPTGDTRINLVGHGKNLTQEGAQALADKVKILHQSYGDNTNIKRIALVGCNTDSINNALAWDFARAVYSNTPMLKNAEITGRRGDFQVNTDGTKTMAKNGKKIILQWNHYLGRVVGETENARRVAKVLDGFKLGGPDAEELSENNKYIEGLPKTLTDQEVDVKNPIGSGTFKFAYSLKGNPNLAFIALRPEFKISELTGEIEFLKALDDLGIKTPKIYKQFSFVDDKTLRHGFIVERVKGAAHLLLVGKHAMRSTFVSDRALRMCNQRSLKDIRHLLKVFMNNPRLTVTDFQGMIGDDGQMYIMDPADVNGYDKNNPLPLDRNERASNLHNLQRTEANFLSYHKNFSNKFQEHIVYIDKEVWEANTALKEKMLKDSQESQNQIIVTYDALTGEKTVVHSLKPEYLEDFNAATIEVITKDGNILSEDASKSYTTFAKEQGWGVTDNAKFRSNTFEDHEFLNLRSNNKHKYNIILQLGNDEATKTDAQNLFAKHPKESVIVTRNAEGALVFPKDVAFTPDNSMRLNIVGCQDDFKQVGAKKLADYTNEITKHYDVNSLDNDAYLSRAALIGSDSKDLSKEYAERLYEISYLRGVEVTGREGNIQINKDGSKTMERNGKKIIHNWDFLTEKLIWEAKKAKNTGEVRKPLSAGAQHLAETTPHQDTLVQNWNTLSQEQIDKLAAESQKTKLSLANHNHQVLIQTESADNVQDSTFELAFKHPTQTTIVHMQKDGTYRIVHGPDLENITGKVKMVVVGYGREKNGVQTLGGRNESELSDNILTLKRDLNPANTTIGRTSLVGCNLESNNPTNNPDSQYGKQVI